MTDKIKMTTPLVEMDGDEMTRVIWAKVKSLLIEPFVDLKSEYYDLGLKEREETDDSITREAAEAIKKYGVGVKCATITPNAERVEEYALSRMYPSPNGTIRAILDGTVFRAPIIVRGILPFIPSWTKPITIARHAYGDVYKNTEALVDKGSSANLVITKSDGSTYSKEIFKYDSTSGIVQGIYNTDKSIYSFARACMKYALDTKQDLWFSTKDTISKLYDRRFRDIFMEVYTQEFEADFKTLGIEYFYTLIDDMVARVIRSNGGYIWACKNYDGDVMSDMVATAYGSLAMMTSVLVSPEGNYEFEAAHGTVQKHYYKYKNGETTSTNSVATIFAWTGALAKRGELDNNQDLVNFARRLETATIQTIEGGTMTGDLYQLSENSDKRIAETQEFLIAVANILNS